ncbi:hypothetical protein [Thioalkalivibrio sp. ALgr3]|uniref:hypothetical protein n=1 Tax=Thioalkalivibrio sp. ALgr3 TaxID=1239292 RepID=UPI00037A9113|nr:hypothetical protein [Thioalkalivibrio sp. ALgr3]
MPAKTRFRSRSLVLALGLPALAIPAFTASADESPIQLEPLALDGGGDHYRYGVLTDIQGDEIRWTVTQGPEITRIHPDEDYRSGLGGREDLFTGPALDGELYRKEQELGVLLPVFQSEQVEPPHTFQDMFDNQRRVEEYRVHVAATGETREIAGETAQGYRLAAVTEMTNLDSDDEEALFSVNHGTVWVYEDVPFSSALLQLSPGMFRMAIGPNVPNGLEAHYLHTFGEALEPLGMPAGLQLQGFHTSADTLETMEAQDWALEEDQSPGQASGIAYRIEVTEFSDDADAPDYAALQEYPRAGAAAFEYLRTPPVLADMLDACIPLPADMPRDELAAMLEEQATFDGALEGAHSGALLGQAAWGGQEDPQRGDGFALVVEAFLPELETAACMIFTRVGAGVPDDTGTLEIADPRSTEAEGRLAAHLLVGDVSEPGDITFLTVGQGLSGEVRLDTAEPDGTFHGHLDVEGIATPLDDLGASDGFRLEGEFSAMQYWDRVPVAR